MKSLQLWVPAQGCHKTRPISISSCMLEGFMRLHNPLRGYEKVMFTGGGGEWGVGEMGVIFFSD